MKDYDKALYYLTAEDARNISRGILKISDNELVDWIDLESTLDINGITSLKTTL